MKQNATSPSTRTCREPDSTGDPVVSQAVVSNDDPDDLIGVPKYGWRPLRNFTTQNDERRLASTLIVDGGVSLQVAGSRNQSYDLEIFNGGPSSSRCLRGCVDPFLRAYGLSPGKYEVKSLWRGAGSTGPFDRRFKVGRRGERIYGHQDARVKSFALALEEYIDQLVEHSIDREHPAVAGTVTRTVEDLHDLIDRAMERRHSKEFDGRFHRIARASLAVPDLRLTAENYLANAVQGPDIVRGFDDIQGVFVVAGDLHTLIRKDELVRFLTFDSACAEGPKLRLLGRIPNETRQSRSRKKERAK